MLHELAFIELLSVRRVACIYIDLSYSRQLLCYLSVYATFIFIHDFTCNRVLAVPVGDEQINVDINIIVAFSLMGQLGFFFLNFVIRLAQG